METSKKTQIMFVNAVLGDDFSALDIAITALASYINAKTPYEASICDLTFYRKNWKAHLEKQINAKKPNAIGISCNTMYMQYVNLIVEEINKNYNLPIILGGHHASLYPEKCIDMKGVTAVIIGDGEDPLPQYLDILSKSSQKKITGVWYKTKHGKVIKGSNGCFLSNLDDLPSLDFDLWDDIDNYLYFLGMLYVQGSRGCPYKCTFCDAHGLADAVEGKYFRLYDPVKFVKELEQYYTSFHHRGLKLFQIFDPVFTINNEWLHQFCQAYQNSFLIDKIGYSIFSRVDNLTTKKIELLGRSGCKIIRMGIENGDEHIRQNIYKKNLNNKTITTIVDTAHKQKIALTLYYIIGGPGESHRTFSKTITFANKLGGERSAFFIYKPFTQEGVEQITAHGGYIDQELWEKADNISFQAVTHGTNWGPKTAEFYQLIAYGTTFGRRWLKTIMRRKHKYFINFYKYLHKGLQYGLSPKYLAMYYHIYGDDNVDK